MTDKNEFRPVEGTIGERIKWYRIMRGISQEKLAELAYSSQSRISDFETERAIPSDEQLQLLCGALNVPHSAFCPPDPTKIAQAVKYLEWLRDADHSDMQNFID